MEPTFRSFNAGDWEEMTRLLNADFAEGGHERFTTVDNFRRGYEESDDLVPERDIRVAEGRDGLIGYVAGFTWRELAGDQVLFHVGRVDPAWKRQGIGTELLGWVQALLAERITSTPSVLRTNSVSPSTTEFMVKNGYEVTQHEGFMVRPNLDDIEEFPVPEGLEVRPVHDSDLRAIYEAEILHFEDHWGQSEEEEGWWDRFRNDPYRDLSLWQVAFDGNDIVGVVRPFINPEENDVLGRKRGYTEDISTRRDWRGKGVASALISRALVAQRDRGMEESALSVHVENPHGAYRLYERHGFQLSSRFDTLDRRL